jgi:hypothetical protein
MRPEDAGDEYKYRKYPHAHADLSSEQHPAG